MPVATANINVCVDEVLKKDADRLFDDLGLTMASAITLFLKAAVNSDGIPFEVKRAAPNAETEAALAEYSEMLSNPEAYKRYDSFDELMTEVLGKDA